ncbi:MAG: class I SAM-dependent methyltransferase [Bacteroidia bacterium]|nr:class I SAM-dependent methyltransferase [Bacteroidia bacterium]
MKENMQIMPCTVCGETENLSLLPFQCKDYTVSGEMYAIAQCNHCQHRYTLSPPSEKEIGKYYKSDTYVSHSDTQEGVINKLYHIVRKRALKKKQFVICNDSGKKTGKILDIGCGTGAFLSQMKQAGWNVNGLEPDEDARKQAETLHGIQPQSPEALFTFAPETFDAVTMWHVLEHVHRLDEYLSQIHAILKKEGVFFVAVPNFKSYDAEKYKEFWAGYDVPRHLHHFCPESMHTLMQKNGFYIDKLRPMPYDAFYVSLLSEKYIHGKDRLFHGFLNGWRSFQQSSVDVRTCSSILYIIRKKDI